MSPITSGLIAYCRRSVTGLFGDRRRPGCSASAPAARDRAVATVRVDGRGGPSFQSDQLPRIAVVIDQRIVERAAVEVQILGLGLAHRVEQLEAGDIGVAPRGDEQHLAVQQLLLGVEHVEHVAGADRLLGARAFERELVGGDRDLVRFDRLERGLVGGEGGAGVGDDAAARPRSPARAAGCGTPAPGGRARRRAPPW